MNYVFPSEICLKGKCVEVRGKAFTPLKEMMMKNKNNLPFLTRLWFIICVACFLYLGFLVIMAVGCAISDMNPIERGMIAVAIIVMTGTIIVTAIISLTILKVVEKKKNDKKDNGEEKK